MDQEERDFYANFVQVLTSLYDVTLHFEIQIPVRIKEEEELKLEIETKESCNIRMSPQHAKSVAALLIKHITEYERDNEIDLPTPPNIEEIWKKYCK